MPRLPALALALLPLLPLAGCGGADDPTESAPASTDGIGASASAELVGPEGEPRGSVSLQFTDTGSTQVDVLVTGLTPGVHGFHLHKTGLCEPDSADPADAAKTGDFLSAGGHLAEEGQQHGDHDGDLPPLIVGEDGSGALTVTTDRVAPEDVLDDDGTAVMVHADADNFANVPERYAPGGPDETTTKTGDAGARVACAALLADGADAR